MLQTPRNKTVGPAVRSAVVAVMLAGVQVAVAQTGTVTRNTHPMRAAVPPDVEQPIITHLRVTGSIPQTPGRTAEDVLRDFTNLYTAGNYRGAALLAEELIDLAPHVPQGYYNLCCALARQRDIDAALDALAGAIDHGWRAVEHTRVDPDLDPLRAEPRFDELVQRMKALQEHERLEPVPLRSEPRATVLDELARQTPALLQRYHVPGAAVAVLDGGRIIWSEAFGERVAGTNEPLETNDRFRLRRPMDFLLLIAAAQQQRQDLLQVQQLLAQADEIGLRHRPADAAARRPVRPSGGHDSAAMTSFAAPAPQPSDHRLNAIDWEGHRIARGTAELMTLAVELTSEQVFHRYCQRAILERAEMGSTRIISRATLRRARLTRSATEQPQCRQTAAIVAGHSRLGTPQPVAQPRESDEPTLVTSVEDLAGLLVALQHGDAALRDLPLAEIAAAARLTPNGLGLGVEVRRTPDGLRVQVAEVSDGVGCLMRWYPDAQRGVVILFNSENGPAAAERIAQIALGGR